MLSCARTRRIAACSSSCLAGVALAAAPAAAPARAVDISAAPGGVPPLPSATVPAVPAPVGGARVSHTARAGARSSMLRLINQQRARHGRGALAADSRLGRAAARHASDMARHNYFGHYSRSGRSPAARAHAAGWHGRVGEIIAWGCGALSSPRAIVRAWLESAPHRAIMLGPGRAVGIGFKRAPGCGGRAYWVADIG
jgi:uncharacterized protein YkwD